MIRSSTVPIFSFLSLYTSLPKIFFLALHPIATALTSSTEIPSVVEPATCAPSLPAEHTTTSPANANATTLLIRIGLLSIVIPFSVLGCWLLRHRLQGASYTHVRVHIAWAGDRG